MWTLKKAGPSAVQAASAFRKAGMTDVSVRIYPLCRHEILNEINKEEVYEDVTQWMAQYIKEPAAAESWK